MARDDGVTCYKCQLFHRTPESVLARGCGPWEAACGANYYHDPFPGKR